MATSCPSNRKRTAARQRHQVLIPETSDTCRHGVNCAPVISWIRQTREMINELGLPSSVCRARPFMLASVTMGAPVSVNAISNGLINWSITCGAMAMPSMSVVNTLSGRANAVSIGHVHRRAALKLPTECLAVRVYSYQSCTSEIA